MRRLAWTWLLIPLLVGCNGSGSKQPDDMEMRAGGLPGTPWQMTPCPMGSTETVADRLGDIKAWALADGQTMARDKADVCMLHTGVNDLHVARVYAAWVLADYARTNSGQIKSWFWVLCTSELTHDNNGGGSTG